MLRIKSFKGGYDSNFSYILWDDASKETAIIDTAIEPEVLLNFISQQQLNLQCAVIMHSHFDHVVGYEEYRRLKIPIAGSKDIHLAVDIFLKEGDTLSIGPYAFTVIEAPGHIYDAICLYNATEKQLFTTDVLFINGCGRCDLAGADVEAMYGTLYNKIMKLPDDTIIYPGHDYGPTPTDTLGKQKKTNPYLQTKSKEEFVRGRMGF